MNKFKKKILLMVMFCSTFFCLEGFATNETNVGNGFPKEWESIRIKIESNGNTIFSYSQKYNWILYFNKKNGTTGIHYVLSNKSFALDNGFLSTDKKTSTEFIEEMSNRITDSSLNADTNKKGRLLQKGLAIKGDAYETSLAISPNGELAIWKYNGAIMCQSLTSKTKLANISNLKDLSKYAYRIEEPVFNADGTFSLTADYVYDFYGNLCDKSVLDVNSLEEIIQGNDDKLKDIIKSLGEFYCKQVDEGKKNEGFPTLNFTTEERQKIDLYRRIMFYLLYYRSEEHLPFVNLLLSDNNCSLYKIKKQNFKYDKQGKLIEEIQLEK